jgi:hypothetical protein
MPEKGPLVFLDYDQAELDAAYDQAAYAPNREQLIKRRISDSELARLRVGEPERVAYGGSPALTPAECKAPIPATLALAMKIRAQMSRETLLIYRWLR